MKNYFIANGEVLNTNMGIEEMESRVQESLDENTSGMAQFRVKKLSEKEVRSSSSGISSATPINVLSTMRIWRSSQAWE